MFRFLLFIAFFSFHPKMMKAQERYDKTESKFITKFSFTQLTGGVVLLKAAFNDIPDSLNFILDTGSGAISLDSTTAVEFKVENYPSGVTVSGIAGIKKVNHSKNNTLHFPGLSVENLDFFINDYEMLTSVYGIKIDGVIGYSFLSRYIVALNYDDKMISVYTPGLFNYPRKSHFLTPSFTTLPIQDMYIKDTRGINGRFYLDLGAGLCLLLTKRFVEDSAFLLKKRKLKPIYVQGMGEKKILELTVVKRIKLGPYVFKNVPTNVLDDEFNALSYPSLFGLIGNDIMRRFNVVLNYPDRLVNIKPNTHFYDMFDYSYSGMNLYMDNSGLISIDDIVKNSPAEKSGLKIGDIVIAVNNNFSNNITLYRDMIQQSGRRINFIVSRNGELKLITMKVGKIY